MLYVIYLKPTFFTKMFSLVPDRVFENPEDAIKEAKQIADNYSNGSIWKNSPLSDCEWKVVQLPVYSSGIARCKRQDWESLTNEKEKENSPVPVQGAKSTKADSKQR